MPFASAFVGPGPLQLRAGRWEEEEVRAAVEAAQDASVAVTSAAASVQTSPSQSHALNLMAPLIRWTGQLLRTDPEDEVPPIHVDEGYRQSLLQLMKVFPYSLQNLSLIGVGPPELIQAGFAARDLREAGFSLRDLRAAGLSLRALRHAGYEAPEFLEAGAGDLGELRALGFSAKELQEAGPEALRAVGFSVLQLKSAGFDAWQLEEAGFSIHELLDAGFGPAQMRYTSLSARDLKEAGFGAKELWEAGYSFRQLKLMQFTDEELRGAGIEESEPQVQENAAVQQTPSADGRRSEDGSRALPGGLRNLSAEQASQVALHYPWG